MHTCVHTGLGCRAVSRPSQPCSPEAGVHLHQDPGPGPRATRMWMGLRGPDVPPETAGPAQVALQCSRGSYEDRREG